jgi:toxin-antitoxin system PIN domain toxin
LANRRRYLFDVNVLVALLDEDHKHHRVVTEWFDAPRLQWAVCPFTEAGFLRYMTRPKAGNLSMEEATALLVRLAQEPGYHYQPISAAWQTLCQPFFQRLFGHKQITDAYLLGLAIHEDLILVTFDKGIVHLAGDEQRKHILLMETERT